MLERNELLGYHIHVGKLIGESWKGKNWVTPTPSSVSSQRKSAAACARVGQLFDRFRTSHMSRNDDGQSKQLKGKRKIEIEKG